MLGNFNLGAHIIGSSGPKALEDINIAEIAISAPLVNAKVVYDLEVLTSEINLESINPNVHITASVVGAEISIENMGVQASISSNPSTVYIEIESKTPDVDLYIPINATLSEIKVDSIDARASIGINSKIGVIELTPFPTKIWVNKRTPTIQQYIDHIKNSNIRRPKYKIELLRKEDETVYETITQYAINNSGSVSNVLNEGVRRTCNVKLTNINNEHTEFIRNLSIGSKFRLHLGYEIDGVDKFFAHGVYVFDDPSLNSELSDKSVDIAGTDKWSMLDGQNGGILNATYKITKDTKIGNLIRSILSLDIVNDPIPPAIHKDLENMQITYDIIKSTGESVADILLEVALNVSAYIYYDEFGRLQMYPVEEDSLKGSGYDFNPEEFNYLTASKQYKLSEIFNAVVVIGENIKNSNTPIVYEAINNDLSDPNSVPNVGYKKVKKVTDYTKGITTASLAEQRANWELRKAKARVSNVD